MLPGHAMAQARTEPPTQQRGAEAYASGHAPRPLLVASAVAIATTSALLAWLGGSIARDLALLFAEPLNAIARGTSFDGAAHVRHALALFAPHLALLSLGALAASALTLAVIQGFRFRLLRSRPRHPFAKIASSRGLVFLLASLGIMIVLGLSIYDALWATREELVGVLWRAALRISSALLLVAACDAALARAAFWRSLWMTRQQRQDETREAYGSPAIKAARERVRRELGSSS